MFILDDYNTELLFKVNIFYNINAIIKIKAVLLKYVCIALVFDLMLYFSSGSQRRRSLSLPVLTLIFPALLPCLVRDSLCTALQTKILWINWSLNAVDTIETWVSGNLTALTERSQPAIRWRVGEVANRVSCGSFRGGH